LQIIISNLIWSLLPPPAPQSPLRETKRVIYRGDVLNHPSFNGIFSGLLFATSTLPAEHFRCLQNRFQHSKWCFHPLCFTLLPCEIQEWVSGPTMFKSLMDPRHVPLRARSQIKIAHWRSMFAKLISTVSWSSPPPPSLSHSKSLTTPFMVFFCRGTWDQLPH
jgi:hypothetical protein